MSLAPTISGRSVRTILALVLAVASTSCVDGDPTGAGRTASIGIAPSFQVVPSDFASGPIDEIRLVALDASTLEVVGSATETVDPAATEWAIDLGLDFGGASSLSIFVEVELLGGGVVEWSGRLGPLTVRPSFGDDEVHEVPVYRGPLDNLDVESVSIGDPPTQMLVGGVAGLGATVQLLAGSDAQPSVYWVSLDPEVATVTAESDGALVLGVGPGTARIAVGAGPALDEIEIDVLPRVESVEVGPLSATVDGLGVQIPYTSTVTNGFGEPADEVVTWSSTDPSVATVDADGLVTTVGFGSASIVATAAGVTGEGTLTVRGPDLVPSAFTATPDGDGEVIAFVATSFDVTVANQGTALAGASTLGIRVLDGMLGTEAHPTLEFAIPPLNPGESFTFTATPEGQDQPVELPSLLSFEAVVDFESVVAEEDESNNVAVSDDVGVLPGPPPGFDVQWLGTTDGSWATASNWSTGQVPTPDQNVYIGAASNSPTLAEAAAVGDLAVDPAGTMDIEASGLLALTGDLLADGGIFGLGVVQMQGSGVEVRGGVPGLMVLGSVVGTGTVLTIGGDLSVFGTLSSETGQTTVVGDVDLAPNGTLAVPSPGQLNATGVLTLEFASVMDVGGTVTAASCTNNGGIILGTGTQPCGPSPFTKVWLGGAAGAETDWHHPDNWLPAGVPVSTDRVFIQSASDAPMLTAAASVASLELSGAMTLDQNSFDLAISGDLRAFGGGILNGVVTLTGSGGTVGGTVAELIVTADRSVDGFLIVGSHLELNDGDLEVGEGSVGVGGDLLLIGSGAHLVMQDLRGVVDVAGNATFTGGSHVDLLSAGLLRVGGDFVASGSNGAFFANGTHEVVLHGIEDQTIAFDQPGPALQHFFDLTVANTGGTITCLSDVAVMGTLTIPAGGNVDCGDDRLWIGTGFADGSDGVSLDELVIAGDVGLMPGGVAANVIVEADWTLPSTLSVFGDLTLNNASLGIELNTLSVSGSFTVSGTTGQLLMNDPTSVLDIAGDATFDGGSHVNDLTSGTIFVGGDFTATASSNTSFVAQGTHGVVLDGTAQVVTFSNPGTALQRFENLDVVNFSGGGVTFASDVVAMGALSVAPDAPLDASDVVVSVGGSFAASGGTSLQELNVVGNLAAIDAVVDADLRVSADWDLPTDLTVNGNLTLANFDLVLAGNSVVVNGDFSVTGPNGQLWMRGAAEVLDVSGDVTFDGGTHAGFLADGELRVGGDFTALGGPDSFVGQSAHTVVLDGLLSTQRITLSSPGPTQQRFANLTVLSGQFADTFASVVPVMGTFTGLSISLSRAPGTDAALDVRGTLDVDVMLLDGLPVRVESIVPGLSQTMSDVTFRNMDPADVQLYVELPGEGDSGPAIFENIEFDATVLFTTGAHLQTERNGGAEILVVDVSGASPAFDQATVFLGELTRILW